MSSHDNEELIDYEDDHEVTTNGAAVTSSTSAVAASASAADGEGDKDKKNFSGIHSTGFRYVFFVPRRVRGCDSPTSPPFTQGFLAEARVVACYP